jgi:hydroxyacylglutathione hydrolase
METFKGNEDIAHGYLICRFDVCYLIDPAQDYNVISKALGTKQLHGILLTHAHNDHVDLIGHFSVPIYMHFDDAHLLFEDTYNGYHPKKHPYKRSELNLRYVNDGDKLPMADQFIEVMHTPGHTKGSLCFLTEGKLFTGDTLFKHSVGRHDLYSGSLPELKKSIVKIMELPGQTKVYPGHDDNTSIREEQKNNAFYKKWIAQKKR